MSCNAGSSNTRCLKTRHNKVCHSGRLRKPPRVQQHANDHLGRLVSPRRPAYRTRAGIDVDFASSASRCAVRDGLARSDCCGVVSIEKVVAGAAGPEGLRIPSSGDDDTEWLPGASKYDKKSTRGEQHEYSHSNRV